jgi:hypothetical protein
MQHSRSTWAGVGTDTLPWRAAHMGALDALKRTHRDEVARGSGPDRAAKVLARRLSS